MPYTVLMHGPSGSGKDTQADLLKQIYDIEKIGTGEMFRSLLENGSEQFQYIIDLMNSGKFISSELTYQLLDDWLQNYDSHKDWIFISVVRKSKQIRLLDELLKKYTRKLDLFLFFKLSEDAAIERMSLRKNCSICGRVYHDIYNREKFSDKCDYDNGELFIRDDDRPEAIKKRLEEYNRTIEPILYEYRRRGILIEIDASMPIDDINEEISNIEIIKNLKKIN
jgi:adenylate kinase